MNCITQIFISSHNHQKLSKVLEYSTGTVKYNYPECEYTLYNDSMIRSFISDHYDGEVLWAYDTLNAYTSKSDLARYCISYVKGGWYIDSTIRMLSRVDNYSEFDFMCFYDHGSTHPNRPKFGLQPSFYYVKKNNIVLEKCIEMVVENCKNKFYGEGTCAPTGPGVFGLCYAKYGWKIQKVVEGTFQQLTPFHKNKNRSYILDDGSIIAQHKCAWHSSNIFDFGMSGINDYVQMWNDRNFYGEKN